MIKTSVIDQSIEDFAALVARRDRERVAVAVASAGVVRRAKVVQPVTFTSPEIEHGVALPGVLHAGAIPVIKAGVHEVMKRMEVYDSVLVNQNRVSIYRDQAKLLGMRITTRRVGVGDRGFRVWRIS